MITTAWHREDIKAAVRKKGTTLTKLATDHGLKEGACRLALLGRHRQGESLIAGYLGIPLWELWPGRWRKSSDGRTAVRIDHRKKFRTGGAVRHRQKHKETLP